MDTTDSPNEPKMSFNSRRLFQLYRGFMFAIVAAILLAVSDIFIKDINYMTVSQLAFVRSLGLFIFVQPLLHYRREILFRRNTFPFLMGRALSGCLSLYLSYLGLKLMPVAESIVIMSTTPVWVIIIARIFLKELIDLWKIFGISFCLLGLVLMSRVFNIILGSSPSKYSDVNYWYGCAASLGSAIAMSYIYVFLRRLKGVHPCVTIAYQSSIGMIVMTVLELIFWDLTLPKCETGGIMIISLCVMAFLGQLSLTVAFKFEQAGFVAIVHEAGYVIVSFFVQTFHFEDIPDVHSILAAVCVVIAISLSALRKVIQKSDTSNVGDDNVRKETNV